MTPEKLRLLVGNAPYNYDHQTPEEMIQFLQQLSERRSGSWGRYAYQVVQDMTDDELMARWARCVLEREE